MKPWQAVLVVGIVGAVLSAALHAALYGVPLGAQQQTRSRAYGTVGVPYPPPSSEHAHGTVHVFDLGDACVYVLDSVTGPQGIAALPKPAGKSCQ